MDYSLHQRGRASFEFLVDLRKQSDRLEEDSDHYAESTGLSNSELPDKPEDLQQSLAPLMRGSLHFRMLQLMRDWTLSQHGWIAMEAFEDIRAEVEPALRTLQHGPTAIFYAAELKAPAYWAGYEFHHSAGGWDGHDYMGFVHGELIHRQMVGVTVADSIFEQRKATARMTPCQQPEKIFEMGCGSGQYTLGIAEAFPDSELWACDLSPRQLEQAQRQANERGLCWHLIQAAAEHTGLAGEQFDLVTSYAMFHEMPAEAARGALAEAYRLLKPGGHLLIADVKAYQAMEPYEIFKADFWNQVRGGDPFWRTYATTDLAESAEATGFADADWTGIGEAQYPFVLTARKA